MDVFSAFPKAVRYDWKIGRVQRATEQGDVFKTVGILATIESVGRSADLHNSPDAPASESSILLYVRPDTLPYEFDCATLMASFALKDAKGRVYDIADAAEGFNQERGVLEHIELSLTPTAIVEED